MKTKMNARLTRALVAALVVCMLACTMLSTVAFAANQAVNDAKLGVLQVNLMYTDDANNNVNLKSGTGFLINDNTVLTNFHVTNLDADQMAYVMAELGKTEAEIKSRLSVSVTISRDVTLPASILTESNEMDFSALRLSSSLQGKTPLKIRETQNPVQQADEVYAIGFPETATVLQSINTYTSADATITQGIVNKIGVGLNLHSSANTTFIQTSCNLDNGNSGGPMVDEYGYVVGICQGSTENATDYYYAIEISQVTEVLDSLGVPYEIGIVGSTPVVTEPEPTETEPVETESKPVETESKPVETTKPTLPPVDDEEGGLDTKMILIIAAVAVAAIVLIVVVVVAGGKKKKAPAPAPVPAPRPVTPVAPNAGFAPVAPTYPTQDAGETTVLGGGAGETTVLSRNTVNGGTLIRKRTGESISINTDKFVIGRERKSVNYCISDNTSVSRNHVTLTVRSGVTFLTDMNAANGTFVNGVKVPPRQEIALKNGDKITLADEDLEYKN